MLKGLTPSAPIISHAEMEGYVARFQNLHGSEEAFVDSQLPGARRLKVNLFGMGVLEQSNIPELRPNIPPPALGFNHGVIEWDAGNGASLHSHTTEEVFMPLIGPWAVTWLNEAGEQEITLQPSDCIYDPAGLYRGFRHVCEGRGTLLALIGGPDTGQVSREPGVLARAAAQGLSRDSEGEVQGFGS
jgi:mannose-6-phosphate isomerase-like protein (cupin superfamily)